ncbi:MAG TPA: hypothetical protein VNJ08_02325 [Bacteriovoracaceae bacterium]|nr:hypothetical protein [Bacteriovoracaceae bacterium]
MKWLALMMLLGCAQVTSLNLKKHQFGIQPTKIIWFQVAGLEEEQIAMLRFQDAAERRTSFENNTCMGKTWNYNLYNIRNASYSTFLAQLSGKKNIKGDCTDSALKPMWGYLGPNGYTTGILEVSSKEEQSLMSLAKCPDSKFLSDVYFWLRQEPPKGTKTYITSMNEKIEPGMYYYDRTCVGRTCGSSISETFRSIVGQLNRLSDKQLFVIRDFSYLEALEAKDFVRARGILADLERAYGDALKLTEQSNDYLAILTTGDSKFVDMPDMGKSWHEFEKKGSGAQVKRTKLTNLVLASGARAENFCGIYEDAEVFERILSGPKQQGLEFKIINPFKF